MGVTESSTLSSEFYLIAFLAIVVVSLTIFFIKKLNYNLNKILKSIWVSLAITAGIEILFFIIGNFGMFRVKCKEGIACITPFEVFLKALPYTATVIFLIVIFIYYLIKFIKRK